MIHSNHKVQLPHQHKKQSIFHHICYTPKCDVCKPQPYNSLEIFTVTRDSNTHTCPLQSRVLTSRIFVINVRNMFQVRTERNALTAIGVTWIVILLVSIPVYVSHGEVTYTYSSTVHTACVFLEHDPVNRPEGYNKPVYQVHHTLSCGLIK